MDNLVVEESDVLFTASGVLAAMEIAVASAWGSPAADFTAEDARAFARSVWEKLLVETKARLTRKIADGGAVRGREVAQ